MYRTVLFLANFISVFWVGKQVLINMEATLILAKDV